MTIRRLSSRWMRSGVVRATLAACAAVVGVIVLWPVHVETGLPSVVARARARSVQYTAVDLPEILGNVALFLPIGLLLTAVLRRLWVLALPLCALASVGIELIQGAFLAGRTADPGDVLANTLGAALGILITWFARRLTKRTSPTRAATE